MCFFGIHESGSLSGKDLTLIVYSNLRTSSISDQTQNQMHDKADDCFDRIFDAISNDWSCDIVVEERKKNEDDDCTT